MELTLLQLLVDRLIQLLQMGKMGRRDTFEKIVTPLHQALSPLVEDYFSFFRDCRRSIQKTKGDELEAQVQRLEERREEFQCQRTAVTQMADVIRQHCHDRYANSYANKVVSFFRCTRGRSGGSSKSLAVVLDLFELLTDDPPDKERIVKKLTYTLANLGDAWVGINESYAVLQLRSIGAYRRRSGKLNSPAEGTEWAD